MENAEAFLKTIGPMHLKDAPDGPSFQTASADTLRRGKIAFADKCARCHSSKQPPAEIATDRVKVDAWYRESVLSPDFLDKNFLSDDRRYPVYQLGTNIARAAGTNAMAGQVWAEFSSETYKQLPAIGKIWGLYNPLDPDEPLNWDLQGGGRGYYRTPTLISMWATAPYLHNNALGMYVKDPSVRGRMLSFYDSTEKLLWPERRLGVQSIIVTSIDTELQNPGPRSTRCASPREHRSTSSRVSIRARCRASPRIAWCSTCSRTASCSTASSSAIRRPTSCSTAVTCLAPSFLTKTSER